MTTPCVRAPVVEGEATRAALAERDLLDGDREIDVEDGEIFVPVVDGEAARAAGYEVVERETDRRKGHTTPADLLGFEPSYERLGEVVILDEEDPERAREIADAIVESDLPCGTVLDRASKVAGEYRVREWDVLSGESTETVHREYGHEFALDVAEVYFSPRLATERHRVVEQVEAGERVVDMFAGVGPFAVPMAARGAEVVACDVNPAAIEYLRENAERNGVADRVTALEGDVRETTAEYDGWADRIVMNLPHSADEFLDTAVRLAGDDCVIHLYDMAHEDDPFGPSERAVRAAATPAGYEVEVLTRREVRSYAPHELNVCLDVRIRRI
ncbi:class I SAM-dependent methyltransferase family protein [Halobaculum sp. CBA1158]|uniref:class I SAM-dependent methyltransferase n=1 Tax=Halobaculum sp. CBA1158 TaxID=2904243 RepID=UPI001F16AD1B|nr:class I SAM-dependent methyltransferase family protein [Halobaculum sp. CBA1158]UIP00434.1 class I SAM-dependent methyltransferase family protein [Halobaculum sp. CBA1158]